MKKLGYTALLVLISLLGLVACNTIQNQPNVANVVERASDVGSVDQVEAISDGAVAEAVPVQDEAAAEVVVSQISNLQFLDAYADW